MKPVHILWQEIRPALRFPVGSVPALASLGAASDFGFWLQLGRLKDNRRAAVNDVLLKGNNVLFIRIQFYGAGSCSDHHRHL